MRVPVLLAISHQPHHLRLFQEGHSLVRQRPCPQPSLVPAVRPRQVPYAPGLCICIRALGQAEQRAPDPGAWGSHSCCSLSRSHVAPPPHCTPQRTAQHTAATPEMAAEIPALRGLSPTQMTNDQDQGCGAALWLWEGSGLFLR